MNLDYAAPQKASEGNRISIARTQNADMILYVDGSYGYTMETGLPKDRFYMMSKFA
jgi:hypothetical protein